MCDVHAGFECFNSYYSCIVRAISESCELFIPKQCSYKDTDVCVKNEVIGWNGNVKVHHAAARRAYKLWNDCGRPRNGPVYVGCRIRNRTVNHIVSIFWEALCNTLNLILQNILRLYVHQGIMNLSVRKQQLLLMKYIIVKFTYTVRCHNR